MKGTTVNKLAATLLVFVLTACGTDEPPAPSCQEAFTHFYSAGCALIDSTGTPETMISVVNACNQAQATSSAACIDALDTWLVCVDAVAAPASNAQCGSCSQEQTSFLQCR